jgi:hypothetical protein
LSNNGQIEVFLVKTGNAGEWVVEGLEIGLRNAGGIGAKS